MKRPWIILLTASLFLAACTPETPISTPLAITSLAITPIIPLEEEQPLSTVATCTAVPQEEVDYSVPGDQMRGSEDPSVTLTVYNDFKCENCAGFAVVMQQLLKDFPDDLQVIFRHYPMSLTDNSGIAAQAAEAAGLQGNFWELHDKLFEDRADWNELPQAEFVEWLNLNAGLLGMDTEKFSQDLTSESVIKFVENAYDFGSQLDITPPYLLIDGQFLNFEFYNYSSLNTLMGGFLIPLGQLSKIQYPTCPEMTIDTDKHYTATLITERGDIRLALYADIAPFAVNNFIFLANNNYYDNVTFHRVIAGFMAQAGDPSATGSGGPGYFFSLEVSREVRFDRAGLLAMANAGPTSNGSQFFITVAPQPHLDGQFTIFGEVIAGMQVVESLTPRDPNLPDLPPGDLILDVIIEEND